MTNTNNITATRMADALIKAMFVAAEREVAKAEAMYSEEQLDEAQRALYTGEHIYFPAADYHFRKRDFYFAWHHKLVIARGRIMRDRRVGQLELAL